MQSTATLQKFGYPDSLIREYEHWVVLLRPAQPTLGSLVMAAKSNVTSLHALSSEAFAEMKFVTTDIERSLALAFSFDKINYLALMMVDREVHFHVIPRYGSMVEFGGVAYRDDFWPAPVDITHQIDLSPAILDDVHSHLSAHWPD